ncbi:MAG: GIY-YIG nuclease family protein [Clostridiales bacterium]|nr:GIY-YIG nuclease family protein [Clostridiales bacterium]
MGDAEKIANLGEYVVYKITSIDTGKVYIGSTDNYRKSMLQHIYNARVNQPGKLYEDMRKYGVAGFKFEILLRCRSRPECDLAEEEYIRAYDSRRNGYNTGPGKNIDDMAVYRMVGHNLDEVLKMLGRMKHGRYLLRNFDKPVRNILYLMSESEMLQEMTNIGISLISDRNESYFDLYDKKEFDREVKIDKSGA